MLKSMRLFFLFITALFFTHSALANLPYYPIQFPRDDAAHYQNVPYDVNTMSEWWYYNGKLTSTTGRRFGYFVSYIYIKVNNQGKPLMFPAIQLQITDLDNKKVYGSQIIYPAKNTFISTDDLQVVFGKWVSLQKSGKTYLASGILPSFQGTKLEYSLQFESTRAPLLEGKTGLIDMTEGTNSYYYSHTHLITSGYIKIGNETFELNPQQSLSWMDHQWGDFILTPWNHWVWASIQLDNGMEMDLAVTRDADKSKSKEPLKTTWINVIMPDDSRLLIKDFKYVAQGLLPGQKHPHVYDLSVPELNLQLKISALAPGQDVLGIWEGISEVEGTYNGNPVKGQANTESTVNY